MRRFCNYFLTLFNVRKLNPFVQFIKPQQVRELKAKVMLEMDNYFKPGHEEDGALNRQRTVKVNRRALPPGMNPNERITVS